LRLNAHCCVDERGGTMCPSNILGFGAGCSNSRAIFAAGRVGIFAIAVGGTLIRHSMSDPFDLETGSSASGLHYARK
jgi:hypothetical protein